jgi:transposase
LVQQGIENLVIDPASIEVERRRRKRKTDRIDATKLLVRLVRHGWGEKVWSVVRVPSEADEDRRRLHRERERLVRESVQHHGRIRGLLATQGLRPDAINPEALDEIRPSDRAALPPHLRRELEREFDRLDLVRRQVKAVEAELKELLKDGTPAAKKAEKLARVKGIGLVGAHVLALEFFGWRAFRNGRQVGALAGLTGTPHQSGSMDHEQGISKAGNSRIRALMTELAWGWLRFQPSSSLSRWYQARFGSGPGRLRRVGIVALARKLLVALWRFVDHGVIPEGAMIRPT